MPGGDDYGIRVQVLWVPIPIPSLTYLPPPPVLTSLPPTPYYPPSPSRPLRLRLIGFGVRFMSGQADLYSINRKYVWPAHVVEKKEDKIGRNTTD